MYAKKDKNYLEVIEIPDDVDCTTVSQHREYYLTRLKSTFYEDCSNIITNYIVYPYLKKGEEIDVYYKDSDTWWLCVVTDEKITSTGSQKLYIHYIGWQKTWREWIDRDSTYVQPSGWHTNNKIKIGGSLENRRCSYVDPKSLRKGELIVNTGDYMVGAFISMSESQINLSIGSSLASKNIETKDEMRKFKKLKTCNNKICDSCNKLSIRDTFYCLTCGISF